MFPFSNPSLTRRQQRDIAHAAQLRQLGRQNRRPFARVLDDMYGTVPSRDLWERAIFGSCDMVSPSLAMAFGMSPLSPKEQYGPLGIVTPMEHILGERVSPSRSPGFVETLNFKDSPQADYRDSGHRSSEPYGRPAVWAEAARSLHEALKCAVESNERLGRIFDKDVDRISCYAEQSVVDYLWKTFIEWDGVSPAQLKENPDTRPRLDFETFCKTAQQVSEAIEDFHSAGMPPLGSIESKLSPDDVSITIEKLEVSLRAIGSLLYAVRTDRSRHSALVKELRSAHVNVVELKELWETRRKDGDRFDDRYRA